MSTQSQAQHFLDKLDELRAIFVLGRRSFPFLKEIIQFVQDITVLLEEVNDTIQEHTGHMPRATSRLKSVSEATELATSEILDLIDEVLQTLRGLEKTMESSEAYFDELDDADEQLLTLLQNELGDEHSELLAKAERIGHEKRAIREDVQEELDEAREALAPIRSSMNRIVMSLQVQDITAQQIASVNHLIESVRNRMNALLGRIGSGVSQENIPSNEPGRTRTFDSNARYDHSPDRQHMADDLVNSMGDGASAGRSNGSEAPSPPQSESQPKSSPSPSASEAASQSDIDAMFGAADASADGASSSAPSGQEPSSNAPSGPSDANGGGADGGSEVASQDDIDELFQQGL